MPSFELLAILIDARMWQVCRGTAVMLVAPTDGTEEIANPFLQNEAPAA